jgi:hypothetical protein
MLIHWQNSYAPCGKRRPGRRKMQSHGTGQQSKNPLCIIFVKNPLPIIQDIVTENWGNNFFRKVGNNLPSNTASHLKNINLRSHHCENFSFLVDCGFLFLFFSCTVVNWITSSSCFSNLTVNKGYFLPALHETNLNRFYEVEADTC